MDPHEEEKGASGEWEEPMWTGNLTKYHIMIFPLNFRTGNQNRKFLVQSLIQKPILSYLTLLNTEMAERVEIHK